MTDNTEREARRIADIIQERVGEEMTIGCWSSLIDEITEALQRAEQAGWDKCLRQSVDAYKNGLLRGAETKCSVEQAEMWFRYLQIPRVATIHDAKLFEKIIAEAIRKEANDIV